MSKTNSSVVDDTFKELDEKLSILNKETKDWYNVTYERGKVSK